MLHDSISSHPNSHARYLLADELKLIIKGNSAYNTYYLLIKN